MIRPAIAVAAIALLVLLLIANIHLPTIEPLGEISQ